MRTIARLSFGTALALLAATLAAGTADAKSHFSVGVSIGLPVYAAPYYAPPPVYYAPPAYYAPAPVYVPPPAYYYPPPAYYAPAPAYYAPRPLYWRHRGDEDDD